MSHEIFVCGGLSLKWQICEQIQVVHICNVVSSITGKLMLKFGAVFLWQASCCSMYGVSLGYTSWTESWVHKFIWQWVGFGRVSYLVGFAGLGGRKL